jgi:hypothetical protein
MKKIYVAGLFFLAGAGCWRVQASPTPAYCQTKALVVYSDERDGEFTGMSHSGTRIIFINNGQLPCSLPRLPRLQFENEEGKTFRAARRTPSFLSPGPVLLPATLMPKETYQTVLRWVSAPAYDQNQCITPARLVIYISQQRITLPWHRTMCAPAGAAQSFTQTPLDNR